FEDFIRSREAALCSPETIDFYRRIGTVETPLSPSKYSVKRGDWACAENSELIGTASLQSSFTRSIIKFTFFRIGRFST
ncbi:MAG: hypothetical protein V3U69_06710, partial [Bacteroidota bacterium]